MSRAAQATFWAVVPAAGRGLRFAAELPKQYQRLAGRTLLEHTLRGLLAHPRIAGVLLVLAAGDRLWAGLALAADPRLHTCTGGAERMDSVLAGLEALPESVAADAFVLVHDAARPLLGLLELERLLAALDAGADGALLALPLSDSIKRADAVGRITASVPRDGLWRALTPQAFRRGALSAALYAARQAGTTVTDEAQAMEASGIVVHLVPGDPRNFKITTAADLALAEVCLRAAIGE